MPGRVTVVLRETEEALTYENAVAEERDDVIVVQVSGRTVARFAVADVARWYVRPAT